ncbi:DUF456 domain-containing protein [Janibacter sp. G56]|uniref:DUF456 domain-containing protein n=1 Tax=Janibacter sp. G56 TaxID=3418717 RepID=UPI003CFBFD7E
MGFLPDGASLWVPALLFVIGLLGIVIPVLPGLLLCVVAVAIWAVDLGTTGGWITLGLAVAAYAAGLILQFTLPGRRMKAAGVGTGTLVIGLLTGVVGFFVIPVIGLPLGFVAGVYVVEYLGARDPSRAWTATKHAIRGVLHSMGIELLTAFTVLVIWVVGIVAT